MSAGRESQDQFSFRCINRHRIAGLYAYVTFADINRHVINTDIVDSRVIRLYNPAEVLPVLSLAICFGGSYRNYQCTILIDLTMEIAGGGRSRICTCYQSDACGRQVDGSHTTPVVYGIQAGTSCKRTVCAILDPHCRL